MIKCMTISCYLNNIDHKEDNDSRQEVWHSTIHRHSTNMLQMPGSGLGKQQGREDVPVLRKLVFSRDGAENKHTGRTQDCDVNCMKNC